MNKIQYKKIPSKTITDHFLNGYIRFQETTDVIFLEDGILKQKRDKFTEDWDQKKLIDISRYLKKTVKNGGVLYAAYDQNLIVGFALLDTKLFLNEYMNMPYIHTSSGYRGYGIGKYLFELISVETIIRGAKKLYISTHPAIESQLFYKRVGCVLTKNINQELYKKEPLDIHLEKRLDHFDSIHNLVSYEQKNQGKVNATVVGRIASMMYRFLPGEDSQFLHLVSQFLQSDERSKFSIGTLWIKKRNRVIREENILFFEHILYNHIHGWGQVDQFCYRVLNPMIVLNENFYTYLLRWSDSKNKDIRRASLVAMIKSSKMLTLNYDYDKMIFLVEKLKDDEDVHVRKAVGWVLKCAYLTYPNQVVEYLRKNVLNLDRMIFRYALEHIEDPLRDELISL